MTKFFLFTGILLGSNFAVSAEVETWICSLNERMDIHSYYNDGSRLEQEDFPQLQAQLTIGPNNLASFKTKFRITDVKLTDFVQGKSYTTFTGISENPNPPHHEVYAVYKFMGSHEGKSANLRIIRGFDIPRLTGLSFWVCDKL